MRRNLQQQAFFDVPGADAGGVQFLDLLQRLFGFLQRRGDQPGCERRHQIAASHRRQIAIFRQKIAGFADRSDNVGEFGTPEWRGQATLFADWSNWRGLWRARYIGKQDEDGGVDVDAGTGFINGDTCRPFLGLAPAPRDLTDEQCANIDFAPDYVVHDASLTWRNDLWSITAGINNVFDRKPPQVDSGVTTISVSSAGNIPLGVGYDLFGRTFQMSIQRRF